MKKKFINNYKDKILRFIHKSIYKPGHYYSAVPDPDYIKLNENKIYKKDDKLSGIELNSANQFGLINENGQSLNEFQLFLDKGQKRYYLPNGFFGFGDALGLFIMFKKYKPKRVIEIGSGFSSALMLDLNDEFYEGKINLSFIEPYPDRLNSLVNEKDNCTIITSNVQEVPLTFFDNLENNDVLFIDSSHVTKIGSDVNYLFFEVLPRLKPGVLIHIHDIYYPFEYLKTLVDYGIYWNEAYLLRSFLSYNNEFSIILWNHYLFKIVSKNEKHYDFAQKLNGGSIWLRKK
jgi:hypothetical protein